ncbi:MAG: T9SS type A sorting domain-containing protein [Bacteroidota bacterium]
MKKAFLLIMALLPLFLTSQNTKALVKDGAVWREIVHYMNSPSDKIQFLIQGDTVLLGETYKKVYKTNYDSTLIWKKYFGAIREDSNARIYFLIDSVYSSYGDLYFPGEFTDTTEVLLYDFSAGIGDTVIVPNYLDSNNIITQIDSIQIIGEYRKKYVISTFSYGSEYWIEGIGSINGLFGPALYEDFNMTDLLCYEDSVIFWDNPEFVGGCFDVGIESESLSQKSIKVFPNPVSSVLSVVEGNEVIGTVEVYNLAGQRIFNNRVDGKQLQIYVADWNPGLYLLKVKTNNIVTIKKFIVSI